MARLLVLLTAIAVLLGVASPAGAVSPTTDADEDYPPDRIENLIDPLGCDPTSISGEIGDVEPGSTITLQAILTTETAGLLRQTTPTGDVLGETTVTAGRDGRADYTIPIDTGRYGTVAVVATGTDTAGDPFTLQTATEILRCPPLPSTGNSNTTLWLQIAGIAVVAGIVIVAAARRRHLRTTP